MQTCYPDSNLKNSKPIKFYKGLLGPLRPVIEKAFPNKKKQDLIFYSEGKFGNSEKAKDYDFTLLVWLKFLAEDLWDLCDLISIQFLI